MPKIPQHDTSRGGWCRFSGCDSNTGICHMCKPDPDLNPLELAALALLANQREPMISNVLVGMLHRAGFRFPRTRGNREIGDSLTGKGLVVNDAPLNADRIVRYEICEEGQAWLARWQAVGGTLPGPFN